MMFGDWMGGNVLPCIAFKHTVDDYFIFALNDGEHTKMVRWSDKACRAASTNGMQLTDTSVTEA